MGIYNRNCTKVIYEASTNIPQQHMVENLPDGGLPSAASGASSSSSNLATVNVISIFGGRRSNAGGKFESILKYVQLDIINQPKVIDKTKFKVEPLVRFKY